MIGPVRLTFSNLLTFLSFMSPFFVAFFMLLYSIINNNLVKALIYLSGLLIVTFINYILKTILKEKLVLTASPLCKILPAPFSLMRGTDVYVSPSLNTTVLAYTFAYLVFPMTINNDINPSLLIFLTAFLLINATVEFMMKCISVSGILFGVAVGASFGILYYVLLHISGAKDLAYFTHIDSNNIQCSKPKKQKFKCVRRSKTTGDISN